MIAMESYPRRNEPILARLGESGLFLLNLRTGQCYTFNHVGGRVWDLCDGMHSVAELVATLNAEYDAPLAEIEADVRELLTDLAGEQLVVEAGWLWRDALLAAEYTLKAERTGAAIE